MNKPKAKGTKFETECVRAISSELADDRVERRALHGSQDMGDIHGIWAHGHEVICECKAHKAVTRSLVAQWRLQTAIERGNADADAALLIVKVPRAPILQADVHLTVADYMRIAGADVPAGEWAELAWVRITLADACALIRGDHFKDM